MANVNKANMIYVVVRSEERIPLRGLSVELVPDKDWVAIRRVRDITGQEGNAQYEISSQQSGKVTFEVQVQSEIIDTVDVEFIVDDGVVELRSEERRVGKE